MDVDRLVLTHFHDDHTDGSMALLLQRPRVLFTGDTVAEHQGQIVLGPFNLDRDRAAVSFRALAELDADVACFGHGRSVVGGAERNLDAGNRRDRQQLT